MMRVWTNNKFEGHWPVGTAAVVVAESSDEAASLLNAELAKVGLPGVAKPDQFDELRVDEKRAVVLNDGDY